MVSVFQQFQLLKEVVGWKSQLKSASGKWWFRVCYTLVGYREIYEGRSDYAKQIKLVYCPSAKFNYDHVTLLSYTLSWSRLAMIRK